VFGHIFYFLAGELTNLAFRFKMLLNRETFVVYFGLCGGWNTKRLFFLLNTGILLD